MSLNQKLIAAKYLVKTQFNYKTVKYKKFDEITISESKWKLEDILKLLILNKIIPFNSELTMDTIGTLSYFNKNKIKKISLVENKHNIFSNYADYLA